MLIRNMYFVIDRRFELDRFPFDAYLTKQEAEKIAEEKNGVLHYYQVFDFDEVEDAIIRNAKK
jgi:hypothetical protein